MRPLSLALRTPAGLLYEGPVQAVVAEDLSGWFGIRPGRADLVAVLAPGLLVLRDEQGEAFAALSGGLLDLRGGLCRVLAREARVSRALPTLADELAAHLRSRRERGAARRVALDDLAREALRRLSREARV